MMETIKSRREFKQDFYWIFKDLLGKTLEELCKLKHPSSPSAYYWDKVKTEKELRGRFINNKLYFTIQGFARSCEDTFIDLINAFIDLNNNDPAWNPEQLSCLRLDDSFCSPPPKSYDLFIKEDLVDKVFSYFFNCGRGYRRCVVFAYFTEDFNRLVVLFYNFIERSVRIAMANCDCGTHVAIRKMFSSRYESGVSDAS